jgi:CBS domain-containing protein
MADSLQYSPMFWTGLFTSQARSLAGKKVSDIMSDPPLTIEEDATLMEANEIIYSRNERRLAVTRKGKAVGLLREQELFFEMARIVMES